MRMLRREESGGEDGRGARGRRAARNAEMALRTVISHIGCAYAERNAEEKRNQYKERPEQSIRRYPRPGLVLLQKDLMEQGSRGVHQASEAAGHWSQARL